MFDKPTKAENIFYSGFVNLGGCSRERNMKCKKCPLLKKRMGDNGCIFERTSLK